MTSHLIADRRVNRGWRSHSILGNASGSVVHLNILAGALAACTRRCEWTRPPTENAGDRTSDNAKIRAIAVRGITRTRAPGSGAGGVRDPRVPCCLRRCAHPTSDSSGSALPCGLSGCTVASGAPERIHSPMSASCACSPVARSSVIGVVSRPSQRLPQAANDPVCTEISHFPPALSTQSPRCSSMRSPVRPTAAWQSGRHLQQMQGRIGDRHHLAKSGRARSALEASGRAGRRAGRRDRLRPRPRDAPRVWRRLHADPPSPRGRQHCHRQVLAEPCGSYTARRTASRRSWESKASADGASPVAAE